MKRRSLLKLSGIALLLSGSSLRAQILPENSGSLEVSPTIRDAYIYAYPIVKNYLTMYQYAVEVGGPQYKGPFNELVSIARVYTPEDTAIVSPNSDTPYSFVVLDLRAEPVVLTLPPVEKDRYLSAQVVDLYTNNVDYLGTRIDGNDGGDYLITGPGWKGEVPAGIKRQVELPTWLGMGVVRTQLFDVDDLEKVKAIQGQMSSQPLSTWTGSNTPDAAAQVEWPEISEEKMAADFWDLAAFLLPFAPAWPGDEGARAALAKLGIDGESGAWHTDTLPPGTRDAMLKAVPLLHDELRVTADSLTDSASMFGTPEQMRGKYLERASAAYGGIYGNTIEEALYTFYAVDELGAPLDGSSTKYRLTFPKDELPPVDAFWSITMYDRKSQLLISNPIDRYLINSAMLSTLKANPDGDVVVYIQNDSPGADLETNWLPCPPSGFYMMMRLYLPQKPAVEGRWKPPSISTE